MTWRYEMITIASSAATTKAIGTSRLSPIARLEPPTATTNRISSVAYAVDDSASDENTARAIVLGRRCSSICMVANGRPTTMRFSTPVTAMPTLPQAVGAAWHVARSLASPVLTVF
jgi:hypothetical protein